MALWMGDKLGEQVVSKLRHQGSRRAKPFPCLLYSAAKILVSPSARYSHEHIFFNKNEYFPNTLHRLCLLVSTIILYETLHFTSENPGSYRFT